VVVGWKGREVRGPVWGVEDGEIGVAFGDGDEEVDEKLGLELVAKGDDIEEVGGLNIAEVL
jgi:hypothetical protein